MVWKPVTAIQKMAMCKKKKKNREVLSTPKSCCDLNMPLERPQREGKEATMSNGLFELLMH